MMLCSQGQHVQRHANWYDVIIQIYDVTIRILRIDLKFSISGQSNLAEGRHNAKIVVVHTKKRRPKSI